MSKEVNQYSHLAEATKDLNSRGYKQEFEVTDAGNKLLADGTKYDPEDVKIVEFHRFEGVSNPSDMSIVYALKTAGGEQGVIIDTYGVRGDSELSEFLLKVEKNNK